MASSMGASVGARSQHRSQGSNTRAGTSVQGVLLEGLRQALNTIETQGWTPRSNQAIGTLKLKKSEGAVREWKHCSYRHSDFY